MSVPLKLTDQYSETTVDDEVVVMHLASGDFFSLNGTAKAIWERIDGVRPQAAIVAALARDYGVAGDAIAPEVDDFLARLREAGLIAGR